MESSRVLIAALIFIVAIVGVNLIMYAVVRGWARSGKDDPLAQIMKAVNAKPKEKANEVNDMDELRRIVNDLNEREKKN